ncbi:beta-carotene hydroxylase 1, chloroplastic-like isoform X1 [Quercus robur]|uniref:beta-carotene hydroxylase 1, chloroplastic-like isoform X1 n=1 Tax=Quercus robur TaxID=38942 RepID=UPI002162477B|nr:beta-carotene hydroxylase 1, chloroplastic-like isoform X1 [Quercus robur]
MATGVSITTSSSIAHRFKHKTYYQVPIPFFKSFPYSLKATPPTLFRRKSFSLRLCFVKEEINTEISQVQKENAVQYVDNDVRNEVTTTSRVVSERLARKTSERYTYLVAAIMSSFGITSMAAMSVYYRFSLQMEGGEIPLVEMFSTFALSVGAAVGMEYWARWAHRALWHASLWPMHESHHRPREGPFELNDVFAMINSVPAIALIFYGFSNQGLVPGLCLGLGLGLTMYGMAYMFVHDGLVHRRFPVGPIANVPYLQRVASAHQLHHSGKFDGVPYGLFLGPKELEKVGGTEALEKEIQRRTNQSKV